MSYISKQILFVQGSVIINPLIPLRSTPDSQGSNSAHRFVAGLFVNQDIPDSPASTDAQYQNAAIRHIARVQTGSTPFISVSSSLIRCLNIAYRNPTTSQIAVIDLHQAGSIGAFQNDANAQPKIHRVQSLNLNTGYTYTGGTEFLIWGAIEECSIISTISLAALLSHLSSVPEHYDLFRLEAIRKAKSTLAIHPILSKNRLPQTWDTGLAVGKLAQSLKIPCDFLHHFVRLVVFEWKFLSTRSKLNEAFLEGVHSEYEANQSITTNQHRPFEHFFDSLQQFIDSPSSVEHSLPDCPNVCLPDNCGRGLGEDNKDSEAKQCLNDGRVLCTLPDHGGDIANQDDEVSKVHRGGQWTEMGGYGPWRLHLYDAGAPSKPFFG